MKIGILQTGRVTDALRETHGDFPDMMIRLLQDGYFIFQTFAVLDGVFPNNATECDGWLLTGSRHSAYDDLPWIATLESFLRAAYAADVPIVGICFGHQILAQALGGKVEKFPLGWAIGPTRYDFAKGEKTMITAWHQDQVTSLPSGATRIATSAFCENAALVYGTRALTYQAHPEFTNAFGRDLLDMRRDFLPQETVRDADRAFDTFSPSADVAQQIVQFFRHRAIRPKGVLKLDARRRGHCRLNQLVIRMFQKIEVSRSRLADEVYLQILTAINQGMIGPSERIVQAKLAEQLQVSRTPIREALFRLEQEGTLVASDRGGFTIRMASPQEVVEVYQARQAIEGYCAAILAKSADAVALSGIEAVIRTNEATAPDSAHDYYDANRQIHRAFVAATNNQYLLEMFDAMWNRSLSFGSFRLLKRDQLRATLNGHLPLLDAILTGDSQTAERAMKEHISDGLQLQLQGM